MTPLLLSILGVALPCRPRPGSPSTARAFSGIETPPAGTLVARSDGIAEHELRRAVSAQIGRRPRNRMHNNKSLPADAQRQGGRPAHPDRRVERHLDLDRLVLAVDHAAERRRDDLHVRDRGPVDPPVNPVAVLPAGCVEVEQRRERWVELLDLLVGILDGFRRARNGDAVAVLVAPLDRVGEPERRRALSAHIVRAALGAAHLEAELRIGGVAEHDGFAELDLELDQVARAHRCCPRPSPTASIPLERRRRRYKGRWPRIRRLEFACSG